MPWIGRTIELRPFDFSDAGLLADTVRREHGYLGPWLSFSRPDYSRRDAEAFIAGALLQWAQNHGFHWGIFEKAVLLGALGYHPIAWDIRSASIGYWITSRARGRGGDDACGRPAAGSCFSDLWVARDLD